MPREPHGPSCVEERDRGHHEVEPPSHAPRLAFVQPRKHCRSQLVVAQVRSDLRHAPAILDVVRERLVHLGAPHLVRKRCVVESNLGRLIRRKPRRRKHRADRVPHAHQLEQVRAVDVPDGLQSVGPQGQALLAQRKGGLVRAGKDYAADLRRPRRKVGVHDAATEQRVLRLRDEGSCAHVVRVSHVDPEVARQALATRLAADVARHVHDRVNTRGSQRIGRKCGDHHGAYAAVQRKHDAPLVKLMEIVPQAQHERLPQVERAVVDLGLYLVAIRGRASHLGHRKALLAGGQRRHKLALWREHEARPGVHGRPVAANGPHAHDPCARGLRVCNIAVLGEVAA